MLPENIPTVTVTARYMTPDGRPMSGTVEFRPPALLTHAEEDLFLGGPTRTTLDAEGRISVVLPATDDPGWNPAVWTYTVTEKLAGLARGGRTYQIALTTALPAVDLADIAPADPAAPQYVAVPGPPGPAGELGPQGPTGPAGAVHSVNGHTEADIVLGAADVSALAAASAGAPGGVATLGANGLVPAAQLPAGGGAVASVNGQTGAVLLTANDLGALTRAAGDARYLALDGAPVTSVNGLTGEVTLTASDVAAVPVGQGVLLTGDQQIDGAKAFVVPPSTTAAPTADDHLARRGYVDAVSSAGTWSPSSMGFSGWAFDPAAAAAPTPQYCISGWVYLIGIPLHAPTTVKNLVFYVPGYVGGTLSTTSSYAGLYTDAGARVGLTAGLSTLIPKTEGTTVVCPLSVPYAAKAGNYWIGLVVNGPSPNTNGPAFSRGAHVGEAPGGSARMPGAFIRHGRLSTTGQTSLPTSFPIGNVVADSNAIWAALS
ncbi:MULTISPECIES: phage tail protein [Streptomyces]|uniref:Phage tail protein n=1 Tax=Streptomyces glycanivorans TaxID=3033808 RepID=A0ABY9JFF8_9ACTN|nr:MULTISPECIES: phage tail protein [unclassified Streptomyces]WSQ78125.1 phage tail protein [Streptomyces sp. NBC_01213]TXS17546.1 phage tail protein [Streptomyces sp. wa22]WLQ64741.1 phage tail protein [Streptomyces sp. Alt3]WSQ85497.1 phage tail protein [Streptomyces sp. NBC_01212]WSR08412.1 phage tail protein [Streptomyces sp. NBC_01208]